MSMHWARHLVGAPYRAGAAGPDEFDCWGLVRYVFRVRLDIDLPLIDIGPGALDNAAAIRESAASSGWRPTDGWDVREWDVVTMCGPFGRHVGVIAAANSHLGVLHAVDPEGVCFHSLLDLPLMGYSRIVIWRRRS